MYSHLRVLDTAEFDLYATHPVHCCHSHYAVFSYESTLGVQGALMLSFAACKAQEAQDALHIVTEQYAAHADAEVKATLFVVHATLVHTKCHHLLQGQPLSFRTQGQLTLEVAKERQQAALDFVLLLLTHGADPDEVYTPLSMTTIPRLCTV